MENQNKKNENFINRIALKIVNYLKIYQNNKVVNAEEYSRRKSYILYFLLEMFVALIPYNILQSSSLKEILSNYNSIVLALPIVAILFSLKHIMQVILKIKEKSSKLYLTFLILHIVAAITSIITIFYIIF